MPARDMFKGGWHPEKGSGAGKSVSARNDFKGVNQLAGWMGKGKADPREAEAARSHSSAPLSSLRDPASFGPPPRHGGKREVQSPTRTGTGISPASKSYASVGQHAFPESQVLKTAPSGGLGTPLPASTLAQQQAQQQHELQEEEEAAAAAAAEPPQPYRANTTGLSTAGLPAPPARRDQPLEEEVAPAPPRPAASRPVPKPPPRLPPRQTENVDEYTPAPPPPYSPTPPAQSPATTGQGQGSGYLNKGALNRLGQSGVSVPGFGIGGQSPTQSTTSPPPQQPAAPTTSNQLGELQQRFSRMPGRVSSPSAQPENGSATAGGGTTWAQKQAALSTANKFQRDASSVSMSDARSAGSTLNNFRQRHGEQVAQGYQQTQGLDKKYGVSGRVGGLAQGQKQQQQQSPPPQASYSSPAAELPGSPSMGAASTAGKKPPPPPPKKKPGLSSTGSEDGPPPVPMSSKPRQ